MTPDVLSVAGSGALARELAFLFAELRRHDDLHRAVEIAVTAARSRHPLPGEANRAPVLRFGWDPQGHPPFQRGDGNFPAEQGFMHRDRKVDTKVVAVACEEGMRFHAHP